MLIGAAMGKPAVAVQSVRRSRWDEQRAPPADARDARLLSKAGQRRETAGRPAPRQKEARGARRRDACLGRKGLARWLTVFVLKPSGISERDETKQLSANAVGRAWPAEVPRLPAAARWSRDSRRPNQAVLSGVERQAGKRAHPRPTPQNPRSPAETPATKRRRNRTFQAGGCPALPVLKTGWATRPLPLRA